MATYATYNLPSITSGDAMKVVQFAFSAHPASNITRVELITDKQKKLSSLNSEITITDATNWSFEINEQVIKWSANTYNFEIKIYFGTKAKSYIKGAWLIT